mmetsp:Transcript_13200/g.39959  ORF Transcript_13200/g.39959 Transcript_13200/m.39959 type:complete len:271 (-) Transcript_13200:3403-4215(-)
MSRAGMLAWRARHSVLRSPLGTSFSWQQARHLAHRRNDRRLDADASWGQILHGAANVGGAIAGKIASTLKSAVGAVLPSSKPPNPFQDASKIVDGPAEPDPIKIPPGMFGSNLLGRMAESVGNRILRNFAKEAQQQRSWESRLRHFTQTKLQRSKKLTDRVGSVVQPHTVKVVHSMSTPKWEDWKCTIALETIMEFGDRLQNGGVVKAYQVVDGGDGEILETRVSVVLRDGTQLDLGSGELDDEDVGEIIDAQWRDAPLFPGPRDSTSRP